MLELHARTQISVGFPACTHPELGQQVHHYFSLSGSNKHKCPENTNHI